MKTIGSNRCSSIDASILYEIKQNICIKTLKGCSGSVIFPSGLLLSLSSGTHSFAQSIQWRRECRAVCIESPGSLLAGIEEVVDNASSFTTCPRELSTAPPSPLCRCIGHIFKVQKKTTREWLNGERSVLMGRIWMRTEWVQRRTIGESLDVRSMITEED